MNELGKKLQDLRSERGMTQRALAQASGLTPNYIVKIEDDSIHGVPSGDALRSLARTLDVDKEELFAAAGRKPSPFEGPLDSAAFTRAVRRMNDSAHKPTSI